MSFTVNLMGVITLFFAVSQLSFSFDAPSSVNEKFLPSWLIGGNTGDKGDAKSNRYLPASLQVLEHTASEVNGTWGDSELIERGARPLFEEIQPIPGLVRLTYLRNSLLMEATTANLHNFQGYTPEVEKKLRESSNSPLPEQLASVLDNTVRGGELNDMNKVRAVAIEKLIFEVVQELRDPKTELYQALRQFRALAYS